VWCADASSAVCPHQDSTTSPIVSANNDCRTDIVAPIALYREDARRTAAGPDAHSALAVPAFISALRPIDLGFGLESRRRLLLEERPLAIALRI
jgi:hypothetical protein